MEIGVDGDRWWVDGDQCWWSACDGASGFWPWEKEEERRERGNDRDIRKKKEEEVLEKETVDKIILKKNIKILFI